MVGREEEYGSYLNLGLWMDMPACVQKTVILKLTLTCLYRSKNIFHSTALLKALLSFLWKGKGY